MGSMTKGTGGVHPGGGKGSTKKAGSLITPYSKPAMGKK